MNILHWSTLKENFKYFYQLNKRPNQVPIHSLKIAVIFSLLFITLGLDSKTTHILPLNSKSKIKLPFLRSSVAHVVDQNTNKMLLTKNATKVRPIASITKLMTAIAILDSGQSLLQKIVISKKDRDKLRHSQSHLWIGTTLSRYRLLQLALMASENRAAAALARTYPGGKSAMVKAMNQKAKEIGMNDTRFVDATGLSQENISSAADLVKLIQTANKYTLIKEMTTTISSSVQLKPGAELSTFRNTNPLLKRGEWLISISKTGFIKEAGRCLVMSVKIQGKPLIIILLNSWGRYSSLGDAKRIKKWLQESEKKLQ